MPPCRSYWIRVSAKCCILATRGLRFGSQTFRPVIHFPHIPSLLLLWPIIRRSTRGDTWPRSTGNYYPCYLNGGTDSHSVPDSHYIPDFNGSIDSDSDSYSDAYTKANVHAAAASRGTDQGVRALVRCAGETAGYWLEHGPPGMTADLVSCLSEYLEGE